MRRYPEGVTTCRGAGCGQPIRFVLTEAGHRMPVNPDPVPDGTLVPARDASGAYAVRFGTPVFHVLTGAERPALEPAWAPHWTTCPASPEFRKRKARLARRCVKCQGVLNQVIVDQGWVYHPACEPVENLPPAPAPAQLPGMPSTRPRQAPEQDPPDPRGCRA